MALWSRGVDQRSLVIEAHADRIRATYEAQRTICLHEPCAALADQRRSSTAHEAPPAPAGRRSSRAVQACT